MKIDNQTASQDLLAGYHKFGSKLGLERILAILDVLGNPQDKLKVVHIAGTNGKGSVCRYIYEVLRANGYSMGLFTSPFVMDFYERIEVDGKYISEEAMLSCLHEVVRAADLCSLRTGEQPTEFEVLTAAAFLYFEQQNLDFVILEVGLGGAGDTTNAVKRPLVSGISSISLDHCDRLGSSEEEIARDKSGIIKPGVPVVSGVGGVEARRVIASRAYAVGAPLTNTFGLAAKVFERCLDHYRFSIELSGRRYDDIVISMVGEHQLANATTALAVLDVLRQKKYIRTTGEGIRTGMRRAKLAGRFETVSYKDKRIILDGAHNEDGVRQMVRTAKGLGLETRLGIVFGVLADKDIDAMISQLDLDAEVLIATQPSGGRGLGAEGLLGKFAKLWQKKADRMVCHTPGEALDRGLELLDSDKIDNLLIIGSLYLIGEVRRDLINRGILL